MQKTILILGMLISTNNEENDIIKDILLNILINESNDNIKIQACKSLSKIKDNRTFEVIEILSYIYKKSFKPYT